MTKKSIPTSEMEDGGLSPLTQIVNQIAAGKLDQLDNLYQFPGRPGINSDVLELAESIGMIFVKLEAREFNLQRAADVENRLKDLNKLKNRHLGIAAHDLRNPISTIRGMSSMLLDMELDDVQRNNFIKSIYRVSNQMLTLVNNLLDVAVIESGKFDLKLENANLSTLVSEWVEWTVETAKKKGIKLTTDLQPIPDSLMDMGKIKQAVDNLLSNAIKFSPLDSTVHISCRLVEGRMEVAFTDQGPGIPPDEADRLFETFQKLRARPTGGEKSTGLGLSIVKNIAEAHGGHISCKSEVGKGSTFTLTIPVKHLE